jgi:hypothetical protein
MTNPTAAVTETANREPRRLATRERNGAVDAIIAHARQVGERCTDPNLISDPIDTGRVQPDRLIVTGASVYYGVWAIPSVGTAGVTWYRIDGDEVLPLVHRLRAALAHLANFAA